jgi:hypothetical protein
MWPTVPLLLAAMLLGCGCSGASRDADATTAVIASAPASDAPPRATAAAPPKEDDADASCEPQMFDHPAGHHGLYAFTDAAQDFHGFRDATGKVVIAPRYRHAYEFSPEGVAAVIDDAGPAFIDPRGRVLARALIEDNGPDYFVGGFARIVDDKKIGFIDARGRIAVRPQFDNAAPFCQGLAVVCNGCWPRRMGEYHVWEGGRWGYVDTRGRVAIPLQYEAAESFDGGKAEVVRGGRVLEIDRRGRVVADRGPAKRPP